MLGVLARLACRPLAVSNIAPAALFRALELWTPTLLIDEVDAFLAEHDEARGILNAGFTRDTAFVIRCVGDDHCPHAFNVWGAKALCGIGKIADTLADRSIPLRAAPQAGGERTAKIRHADPAAFAELVGRSWRASVSTTGRPSATGPACRGGQRARMIALMTAGSRCWLLRRWPGQLAPPGPHRRRDPSRPGGRYPSIGAELLASIREAFDTRRADVWRDR